MGDKGSERKISVPMDSQAETSKRPDDSDFKQQRLRAWQPLLTPNWIIVTFIATTIVFIPVGFGILSASQSVVQTDELRYDELCASVNGTCKLNVTIPADMAAPVFAYYKLTNFYQNHRRYVKSRSDAQLSGKNIASIGDCDPAQTNSIGGVTKKLYPCGLIANSFFNDSFSILVNGDRFTGDKWQKKGIAWKGDVSNKFKNGSSAVDWNSFTNVGLYSQQPLPSVEDEEFIVWMRVAGLPTFKKLYRIINTDLHKGDVVEVEIQNNFPVSAFSGQKAFILSNASVLGGRNDFLGYAFIVVGAGCGLFAIIFGLKQKLAPRVLGDMQFIGWHPYQRVPGK
jgi:hypothetical protein